MREVFVALLGLGLMLLSLHLMRETLKPLEESQTLRLLLGSLTRDTIMNMGLAALFAWIAHSSVAAVLFVMSLAGSQLIDPQAAMAMVLGANLGAAINPLTAAGADRGKRRIAAGNLAMRLAGCAAIAPLLPALTPIFAQWDPSPTRLAADFHLAFNLALALIFICCLPALARLLNRLIPEAPAPQDARAPRYLDRAALTSPAVALSNAARETLRMSDTVDQMLRGARKAFAEDDRERVRAIRCMDDDLDQLYRAIQLYLGEIDQHEVTREEAGRIAQIVTLTINLEHVGDIIDSNLMQIAADRIENNLALAPADLRKLEAWIALNREPLIDYRSCKLATD
jgi:phosphate:Na+ symporter